VLARVQPEANPATEQALARARQMLELDELLIEQGFSALPVVRPPRPSSGQPYQQGELLAQRLRSRSGLGDADLLARYRVSLDALAFWLHNLGIINAAGRDAVRRVSSARIALRQGRASDLQACHDQRWPDGLLRRAVEAYAKGRISIRPIAQLIKVDPDTLLEELAPPRPARPGAAAGPESDDELVPML
jgi:hypothetical protein